MFMEAALLLLHRRMSAWGLTGEHVLEALQEFVGGGGNVLTPIRAVQVRAQLVQLVHKQRRERERCLQAAQCNS